MSTAAYDEREDFWKGTACYDLSLYSAAASVSACRPGAQPGPVLCADRLNGALAPWPQYQDWPLERLLLHWCQLPRALGQAVRRYGGGTYNHTLYFSSLAPARTTKPSPALLAEIEHSFGSMEGLHRSMKNAAASIFGSGWVWLVCCSGGLQIVCTANQDTPLPLWPLVNMDLWEHAFLPDYENRRDDYMEAALAIIDWDAASRRFEERTAISRP